MKLSRPAGSSDLEEARAIARRLSRGPGPRAPEEAPASGYVSFGSPRPEASRPHAGEKAEPAAAMPAPESEPEPAAAPISAGRFGEEAEPPQAWEDAAPPTAREELEPEPAVVEPVPPEEPEPSSYAAPAPELEAPGGEDAEASEAEAEPTSVDSLLQGLGVVEGEPEPVPPPEIEPPSWAEILERCQGLAGSEAAMLVTSEGDVVEACGNWPASPRTVAAKLRPLLDKKEQTGQPASLSVRLGERLLTAWRLELGDARVTVALLAETPVAVGVRPAIEDELRQGRL